MTEPNDPDSEQKPLPDFSDTGSPEDFLIEALQRKLVHEVDVRKEERFVWFAVLIIVVDLFVFPTSATWAAPISITVLQVLLLIVVGRKWGVDDIWTLTEKLIDKWGGGTR